MLLQEGEAVRGRSFPYTVERFLGEGAFAEVYRVKHRLFGRQAMKVFKTPGTIEETELALEEAIFLSQIGHRNVIRVFDADILEVAQGSRGFFTMEYVAGGSLEQFWQSHGDQFIPVDVAVDIVRQVCSGLHLAHSDSPPMIHRDIKPQNILVGYDAHGLRACVSDFGLAKRVNPLKLMASARGTRCFKAPETFRDPMSDSCAGDVWAVGLTLYLLLTDRFPYGGDIDTLDIKSFEKPLIPPSRFNIQVDSELDQLLYRALSVKREGRYQNAGEMLEDLNRWQPRPIVSAAQAIGHSSSQGSKLAFGAPSPADEEEARAMVTQAIQISRQRSRLAEASDLMEEAFNKWPALRPEYQRQLELWRRGVIM